VVHEDAKAPPKSTHQVTDSIHVFSYYKLPLGFRSRKVGGGKTQKKKEKKFVAPESALRRGLLWERFLEIFRGKCANLRLKTTTPSVAAHWVDFPSRDGGGSRKTA